MSSSSSAQKNLSTVPLWSVSAFSDEQRQRARDEEVANVWDMSSYPRQERAIAAAQTYGAAVWAFDRDPDAPGSKRYGVGGRRRMYEWMRRVPPAQRFCYELLTERTPSHLLIDIDIDPALNPALAEDPATHVLGVFGDMQRYWEQRLRDTLGDAWFDAHAAASGTTSETWIDWALLTASNEHKLSYHGIGHMFGGRVMMQNNAHVGALVRAYQHARPAQFTHMTPDGAQSVLDPAIYGRNRCFRTAYSSKLTRGEPRPLCAMHVELDAISDIGVGAPTYDDFAQYLVAHVYTDRICELLSVCEYDGSATRSTTIWDVTGRVSTAAAGGSGGVAVIMAARRKRTAASSGSDDDDPAFEELMRTWTSVATEVVLASGDAALNGDVRSVAPIVKYFAGDDDSGRSGTLKVDVPGWRYCHLRGARHHGNNVYYLFRRASPAHYEQRCYSQKGCQRRSVQRQMPPAALERLRTAEQQYRAGLVVDFSVLLAE